MSSLDSKQELEKLPCVLTKANQKPLKTSALVCVVRHTIAHMSGTEAVQEYIILYGVM